MRIRFFIIFMLLGMVAHAQTGGSAARVVFDGVVSEVESHYAGFNDKVTPASRPSYDAMVKELRDGLPGRDVDACIGKYLGWFQDLHLCVRIGGKRLVSYERRAINYADSMVYKPSFVSGSVNENCFLIRIPSMQVKDGTRKFIAKAVRQYKRSDCLYLILDLRGNGGGADGVYYPLVELAYDHPGRKAGAYFRNTDSNRAFFMEGMKRNRVMMKTLRACADKPDSLVCLVDVGTLTLDKVHKDPRRIAVIIDNHVASNAENLLLELQSVSERIVLYGRDSTLGCVDYVNPRPYAIPSRDMVVYIPTTRSGRLLEHPVDPAGIAPEVIIPLPLPEALTDNIDTWTRWVAEDLVKRESGG